MCACVSVCLCVCAYVCCGCCITNASRAAVTKSSMHIFLHHEAILPREAELIKSVPDTEMFTILLNHIKVATAGGKARGGGKKKK